MIPTLGYIVNCLLSIGITLTTLQVNRPCIPCRGLCSEVVCDSSCPTTPDREIDFTISDIDLTEHWNSTLYLLGKSRFLIIWFAM